MFCYVNSCCII